MEQENTRFQIEMSPSQNLMKEAYQAVLWHSWRAWVYAVGAASLLGLGLYRLYKASVWANLGWADAWSDYLPLTIYCFVLAALLLFRLLTAPGFSARKYMKRLTAVHGDAARLKIVYRFDASGIHSQSSTGQQIDTAYDQIVSVHETSHGIVLRRKENLFEVLEKSGIQGGTLGDFRTFLEEKMPHAKRRWKLGA